MKYLLTYITPFGPPAHEQVNSLDKLSKRAKRVMENSDNGREWKLYKATETGDIVRCTKLGAKLRGK